MSYLPIIYVLIANHFHVFYVLPIKMIGQWPIYRSVEERVTALSAALLLLLISLSFFEIMRIVYIGTTLYQLLAAVMVAFKG